MRKNFGVKTWLYPMPVLIIGTYDEAGNANVMNAAWGGIYDTNQIAVCIDPGHKTAENLQLRRAFTVSIGIASQVTACDYVGLVSGRDVPDKLSRAGWHAVPSEFVDAPLIRELPMTLECELISYDTAAGCTVGAIKNISADESILDENGDIDPAKLAPICYDPVKHLYHQLGEAVGTAFKDGLKLK